MLPDRVSNPGPLTYESGALPIAPRGPAKKNCDKTTFNYLYYPKPWCIINAKIRMRQYIIFVIPQNFDTADIKCFTVAGGNVLLQSHLWSPNVLARNYGTY